MAPRSTKWRSTPLAMRRVSPGASRVASSVAPAHSGATAASR